MIRQQRCNRTLSRSKILKVRPNQLAGMMCILLPMHPIYMLLLILGYIHPKTADRRGKHYLQLVAIGIRSHVVQVDS